MSVAALTLALIAVVMAGAAVLVPQLQREPASAKVAAAPDRSRSTSIVPPSETALQRLDRLLPSLPAVRAGIMPTQEPLIEQRILTQTRHDGHVGLYTDRPNGYRPVAIVMHATGSGRAGSEFDSLEALGDFFQRQGIAASHYAVDRSGRIMQYVSDDRAAFHVSQPGWNGISIGIELLNDNTGTQPFPDAQMRAARQLVQHLGSRYGISAEAVVQHRVIQPEDRSDPAANFDWDSFAWSIRDPSGASTSSRRSVQGSARLPA